MSCWLLTSEHWCEQSGDDTASIDGEVEEGEKPPQEIFLQSKEQCVLGTVQFRVFTNCHHGNTSSVPLAPLQ